MMLWVPQGHTMDKCLIQDAGFIPLSLAPELGMFNPFTSAREALIPGQARTEFQGVSAAVTFVGIINMTISPLTTCRHSSHRNALVCHHQWLPPWEVFLSAAIALCPKAAPSSPLSTAQSLTLENQ